MVCMIIFYVDNKDFNLIFKEDIKIFSLQVVRIDFQMYGQGRRVRRAAAGFSVGSRQAGTSCLYCGVIHPIALSDGNKRK